MEWRLGLDLGTNSLGWSVFCLNKNKEVENLVDLGVRIFSDGRDQKSKEPLAVERRIARGQRTLIYRRKLRRRKTFRILQEQGLFPKSKEECMELKTLNPYELRVKALDEKLEPFELGRALFNLSVRRGFKSNRKDGTREDEDNKNSNDVKTQGEMQTNLERAINENDCRTLGEFLYKNQDTNGGLRFVPNRMKYYPTRKMYETEFDRIREAQEKFYGDVKWDDIYDAIFNQRPLEPQQKGYCQFMHDKERTYKAMPCAQKARILQDIRNLCYYNEKKEKIELNDNQDQLLYDLFNEKNEVKFDQIRKKLGLNSECKFNLEENRDLLKGNSTAVKMSSKNRFGKLWNELSLEEQDLIVEKIITAQEDTEVYDVLNKYNLTDEQKDCIVKKTIFPSGTSMLCKEFSEKLVHRMEEISDLKYHEAVESLGFKFSDQSIAKYDLLPYYGKVLEGSTMGVDLSKPESQPEKRYGKISNPTVHVALNQTRVVVNALIKEYGKPTQIAIELSRDLKNSVEQKNEILKKQNQQAKLNKVLNDKISETYKIKYPNRNDRLKFRLWEELGLGCKCIYCGKGISGAELFTKEIEIEHILPFSRTLLDAESNLTVAHSSCNAFKAERSPYEAFSSNPKGFVWDEIVARANQLKNISKKNKFSPTAMENFEKDQGFIARQLSDNQYIAKAALRYLKCLVENDADVWATNGSMTKILRDKWEMDSILCRKFSEKEVSFLGLNSDQIGNYIKNRFDHRHHAVDAVVIGLTDRSLVQKIATKNSHKRTRIEIPKFPIYRLDLEEKVKNIVVSFKPEHGAEGKLSKETLLGKIKVRGNPEPVYVSRQSIVSLSREKINKIIDDVIRKKLIDFIDIHKGEKLEDILTKFSILTGIKKVRCKNKDQKVIKIDSGSIPRYYGVEDYFAAIIWEIPGEKKNYKAQYIRRNEVTKDSKGYNIVKPEIIEKGKPHPAAKQICLLHKDDYLEFSENGKFYKCRIAGFFADQCLDVRPIYSAKDYADWFYSTNEKMIEISSVWLKEKNGENAPQSGQNKISVNTVFRKLNAKPITVNPIGRVFRKK